MKKILLTVLLAIAGNANASMSNATVATQIDASGTYYVTKYMTEPSGNGLYFFDASTKNPSFVTLGSGLNVSGGILSASGTGTVTSITAGTGLSGGVITTSGTISLPNIGTAGTYNTVTTDAQGRVSAGTTRIQSSASRSLNTGFQISSTRDAMVYYSVQATVTASIGSGQDGDLFLDIASDSGFTTNLQTLSVAPCSQTYTLAVALQGVQKCPLNVSGYVPASYYTRLRTVNNVGTPSFSYRAGQEVLL